MAALANAPPVTITSPKRTYTLLKILGVGDASDIHLATSMVDDEEKDYLLKISRVPGGDKLLDNEKKVVTELLTQAKDDIYRRFLPTLAESFLARDAIQKRVNVYLYEPDFYTLEEVRVRHPILGGRHLAWIFKRLLEILGFIHNHGFVHGALLPTHIRINGLNRGLQLMGWIHAAPVGETIKTISVKFKDWYPREVLAKEPASPATDLFMAAQCLNYLAGGDPASGRMSDAVPKPMQRIFRACLLEGSKMRPEKAWNLHEDLVDVLKAIYGSPRYEPLHLT